MLISPVIPMMSMYHLPHGQLGYNGHVVNLPQDVTTFVNSLPRHPNDLDIIIVRQEHSNNSHHDFRVRRSKVLDALNWLIANNVYFSHVTVNDNNVASLPEDDDLSQICTVTISSEESTELPFPIQAADPYTANLSRTLILFQVYTKPNQKRMYKTVIGTAYFYTCSTVMWPARGLTPINESSSEGYFTCGFPSLFPTGAADFLAPRINTVTIGNYLKHLLLYDDGRFARHSRFWYFTLNTEMRWHALQTGRVYVRQNPEERHLSIDELRDMVDQEGENFSNRVLRYAASIRGTRQYWFQQRTRLMSMVDTLGIPTIFFTHSAADFQWPDLARLFQESDSEEFNQREAVVENPAIADWFFYYRVQKFVDCLCRNSWSI